MSKVIYLEAFPESFILLQFFLMFRSKSPGLRLILTQNLQHGEESFKPISMRQMAKLTKVMRQRCNTRLTEMLNNIRLEI